jgi:hypothetical protein
MHEHGNSDYLVGYEVLTAVVTYSAIFWDTSPCSLLKVNRRFGRTYRFYIQGRINRARYQREDRWLTTDVSEENIASISMAEKAEQDTSFNAGG